jgi:hypothetical protein
MPSQPSRSFLERRATRRALMGLAAAAVVAVAAFLGARAVARDDASGTPAHTVRDFLIAAVAERNGLGACAYLTPHAVDEVLAAEPHGAQCRTVLLSAGLTLGSQAVRLESTFKGLTYDVEQRSARARVTVRGYGGAHTFLLRKATQAELSEFQPPPTSWRIDSGVSALVRG